MKYRKLTLEELKDLEKEFIHFLSANSITGEDWVKIKTVEKEKADRLIGQFSDIVFDKILKDVELLEQRTATELRVFKFYDDKAEMIGLTVEGETQLDFRKNDSPQEMMAKLKLSGGELKIYTAEKKYNKLKEMEIFYLLESGCKISKDEQLFQALKQIMV